MWKGEPHGLGAQGTTRREQTLDPDTPVSVCAWGPGKCGKGGRGWLGHLKMRVGVRNPVHEVYVHRGIATIGPMPAQTYIHTP